MGYATLPLITVPSPLGQRLRHQSKHRGKRSSATRSDESGGASSWRHQQQMTNKVQEANRLATSSISSTSSFVSSPTLQEFATVQGTPETWEWWTAYFNEMDDAVRELEGIEMELASAVDAEDYGEAARLCEHKKRLESGDCVTTGLQELATAVQQERYADAAALRDGLGAGILGWWVGQGQGQGQEEDPFGHLLHVSPDFGRFVGHAFSGVHLAELVQAVASGGSTNLMKRISGFSSKISFVVTSDNTSDNEGGEGDPDGLGGAGGWDSHDDEVDLTREDCGIPLFELFVRKNGKEFGYWQQAAALQTPSPTNLLESSSVAVIDDVTDLLTKEIENGKQVSFERGKKENGVDFIRINVRDTVSEEWSGIDDDDDENKNNNDDDGTNDINDDMDDEKQIMHVTDLLDDEDEDENESEGSMEASTFNGDGIDNEIAAQATNTLSEMGFGIVASRVPAAISWQDRDTFELVVPGAENEEDEKEEAILPTPQPAAAAAAATAAVEVDIGQSSDSLSGRFREEIESMVKDAMTVAVAQGIGAVGGSGFTGNIKYRRLHGHDIRPSTDPFSGVYVGSFGPHGPEAVLVKREIVDGEEWAIGTKLTGDPNVPAGKVTFRAKIGREHRMSPAGTYAPEFSVQQRYKGQGKVAREGYSNAKWVDGELLTFSAANPITRGAELGFVYEVDSRHKFVLLFTKVDLDKIIAQD